MADLNEVLALVERLAPEERQALARALRPPQPPPLPLLLQPQGPRPQSEEWVRSERGHAVLDTGAAAGSSGPASIFGIWRERREAPEFGEFSLAHAGPAVVATEICVDLVAGVPQALRVFETRTLEPRLTTPAYLQLLALCDRPEQRRLVQEFAARYPVLSLGPVASGSSVEILLRVPAGRLDPLQALVAATAMAHEIPLLTTQPEAYEGVDGLRTVRPYGMPGA